MLCCVSYLVLDQKMSEHNSSRKRTTIVCLGSSELRILDDHVCGSKLFRRKHTHSLSLNLYTFTALLARYKYLQLEAVGF